MQNGSGHWLSCVKQACTFLLQSAVVVVTLGAMLLNCPSQILELRPTLLCVALLRKRGQGLFPDVC